MICKKAFPTTCFYVQLWTQQQGTCDLFIPCGFKVKDYLNICMYGYMNACLAQ